MWRSSCSVFLLCGTAISLYVQYGLRHAVLRMRGGDVGVSFSRMSRDQTSRVGEKDSGDTSTAQLLTAAHDEQDLNLSIEEVSRVT